MDLNVFKVDPTQEVDGVWVDVEFRGQVGKFKIARAGNQKFNRIYAKLKNQRTFVDDNCDAAVEHQQECMDRAFAEAILLDTGDEITNDGEPVKYTPEVGYILMADPSLVELKNQLAIKANDFELFAVKSRDEIVKN